MTSKNYPNPAMRVPLVKKKPAGARTNSNGTTLKTKRIKKKK